MNQRWQDDELNKIAETDDLHISPFREDGVTYGTPTWIWSVVVDDALDVRAYNGQNSRWYKAAMQQQAGRISAAGMEKEVSFAPVDGPINGLTQTEAGEVLTHLAFYAGWPNAFSAVPVVQGVFEGRAE